MVSSFTLALTTTLCGLVQAQPPDIDPKAVNTAIDKGAEWLLSHFANGRISEERYAELVLLTLIHAGVPPQHPFLQDNVQRLLSRPLQNTYNVGLRSLLLEKVNRKFYQMSLAEIAQFFTESQCDNGQWAYAGRALKATPTVYAPVLTPSRKRLPPGSTQTADDGPAPGKELKLPPPIRGFSKSSGDNSNTQYAVLGLFAASRAAIIVPKATWSQIEKWFESRQNPDGGWGYNSAQVPGIGRVTTDTSSGAMTTAALTALVVAKFYQNENWRNAASVERGVEWLGRNFSVTTNPGGSQIWHYYYLYGLERVGAIAEVGEFGAHRWYKEGAEFLLKAQNPDGSWRAVPPGVQSLTDAVTDTCFAILFLRRATPDLKKPKDIATGVSRKDDGSSGVIEEKKDKPDGAK